MGLPSVCGIEMGFCINRNRDKCRYSIQYLITSSVVILNADWSIGVRHVAVHTM